ncbi:hypothetical protein [Roseateles sp.]|uniref:portal protein n=1 Tax=Roseateles sp. TaxID=1971397 RepID=UPI002DF8A59A|nr:hypothetical protein [Roseateles sp.]
MDDFEYRAVHGRAPGDGYDREMERGGELVEQREHRLDSDEARAELRRLLAWWYHERDRQAANRLEMATDADFYDNLQWSQEDAAELASRGQAPLVFNEVAPMADWVIGTERRSRVDWSVLPRTEDDVAMADVKTKVLKYVSDVNRAQFVRSRAFADAVKSGVGWLDDGVRDDPTQDIIYSRYEDWRNVLQDSAGYELDLSDARYVFRWRWVDEDIAMMMFPDRKICIQRAMEDRSAYYGDGADDEEFMLPAEPYSDETHSVVRASGVGYMASVDTGRRRVKLIECQYRKPVPTKLIDSGPLRGAIFNPGDRVQADTLAREGGSIIDKVMLRVHYAVFTETHMLAAGVSNYRHNRFSLTPVWCYRMGRNRLPYGVIRRVRDLQKDLNKRASKALYLLSTNQIIVEEGAVTDLNKMRDEVNRPDGDIVVKNGSKRFEIRRDSDAASGQINMMTLDAQAIQKSAGVSDENLGRQTNAVSGEAIKARQLQGSVVTTEIFDNLRLACQIQGEKQLSLVEQYYSEEKVIRLTGAKGKLEWVRINTPELQPDGSVRYINDITSSMADFKVDEQDYSGSLRHVMFEALNQMAQKLPPEVALRMLTIAMEFSDLPNKNDIAEQFRKITGEKDPNKELTPEEQQQAEQQAAQQAEALEMGRKQAVLALGEQQAKIKEINARAAKLEAEAWAAMQAPVGGDPAAMQKAQADMQAAIEQVRRQAADEVDRVSEELRKVQADAANKIAKIARDADTKVETARIAADAAERTAEIQAKSNERIAALKAKQDQIAAGKPPRKRKPKPAAGATSEKS